MSFETVCAYCAHDISFHRDGRCGDGSAACGVSAGECLCTRFHADVELIQEDPGPNPNKSALAVWLDAVREHPGVWFKYPEPKTSSVADQIKKGQGYGAKRGEFEVTRRVAVPGPPRLFWTFARTAIAEPNFTMSEQDKEVLAVLGKAATNHYEDRRLTAPPSPDELRRIVAEPRSTPFVTEGEFLAPSDPEGVKG